VELQEFILQHENDDTAALVLARDRWPDVDVALAAACIEARRKLRDKVPEWYADPRLVFPSPLGAEQCSSTVTARFKAGIAAGAAGPRGRIADLTGGLGVDSWQFSLVAGEVLHNEMQPVLHEAAKRNFDLLGCGNIRCSSLEISPENIRGVLDSFSPTLVFLDPARRSGGRKVFRLQDCSPDVLTLKDAILERCPLLLKLSPMADISLICKELGQVKQVWAVQSGGECKELLALLEPGFAGEYAVTAADADSGSSFSFLPSEERAAAIRPFAPEAPGGAVIQGLTGCLFEPGPALMKAGAFRLLCGRFPLKSLGGDCHYYISGSPVQELGELGKWFRIEEIAEFGNKNLKDFAVRYPDASVTARALPVSSDELRSRMKLRGGGTAHIFALGTATGRLLISASRCFPDPR